MVLEGTKCGKGRQVVPFICAVFYAQLCPNSNGFYERGKFLKSKDKCKKFACKLS